MDGTTLVVGSVGEDGQCLAQGFELIGFTPLPTGAPVGTESPTMSPVVATNSPTSSPVVVDSPPPTSQPTVSPTSAPTGTPTLRPTITLSPTETLSPTISKLALLELHTVPCASSNIICFYFCFSCYTCNSQQPNYYNSAFSGSSRTNHCITNE